MKYIYSVLASFCLLVAPLQKVSASHAMGAEITFKHTSGTNFQIRMRYWRFVSGIPAPATQQVVFHTLQPSNGPTIPNVTITQMSSVIISQNMIQEVVYQGNVSIPAPIIAQPGVPYTIRAIVSECCRNNLIQNVPNSAGLNLITETIFTPYINGVPNSSPSFLIPPEPVAAVNQLYAHNPLAMDSDGDSLTFRLDTPRTLPPAGNTGLAFPPVTGYVYPWQLPSALSGFNPSTGTVLWLPTFIAHYQYRYAVDEWRNGIRIGTVFRDVQVAVVNGGQNTTAPSIQVNGSPLTGLNLPAFTVAAGSPVTFNVSISDPDATQKQLAFSGDIFDFPANPATFTIFQDTSLLLGTFYWTPGAGQDRTAPYLVHLKYREITSLYAFSRDIPILITVTPSVSGITGNTLPSESDQFSVVHLADGTAGLRYQFSSDTYLKVVVFDMQGRAVATVHEGVVSGGQHLHMASLQALQSGAYVFRATTDKGKLYTAKWIK